MKVFSTKQEFERFFSKFGEEVCKGVELVKFEGYEKNRVLIIAPHAGIKGVKVRVDGVEREVHVGDENTHILAKVAAWNLGSAALISYVPRDTADFARDPEMLGKELFLPLSVPTHKGRKKILVRIHRDRRYYEALKKFHREIEKLDPKFILSYHGMGPRFRTDVLLGFGEGRKYIGGVKNAFKFRELVRKYEKKMGIDFTVKIAKRRLLGRCEYNLAAHVREGRFGALVEFNYRLREGFPGEDVQKLGIAVARAAGEWVKENE